jgi:hypothetical protein
VAATALDACSSHAGRQAGRHKACRILLEVKINFLLKKIFFHQAKNFFHFFSAISDRRSTVGQK